MSARTIVSYDDITEPFKQPDRSPPNTRSNHPPPAKKRKKSKNRKTQQNAQKPIKQWDSQPFQSGSMSRGGGNTSLVAEDAEYEQEMEEDLDEQDLTHDEIWDDSALIDAWDAAMEEHEMMHGPDKEWKKQPVNKSALWHKTPSTDNQEATTSYNDENNQAGYSASFPPSSSTQTASNSQPFDFATFVPGHDPSLSEPNPLPSAPNYSASGPTVTQDEAFSRALNAMYWGGYWTAVYHCQQSRSAKEPQDAAREEDDAEHSEEDTEAEENEEDEFVSTQR